MTKRQILAMWIVITILLLTYNLFYAFVAGVVTLIYFFTKFTPSKWWDDANQQ